MNNEYLQRAKKQISDVKELILLASKRAQDLALGKSRPMINCKEESYLDVALLEIAEGKLQVTYEEEKPVVNDFFEEAAKLKESTGSNVLENK